MCKNKYAILQGERVNVPDAAEYADGRADWKPAGKWNGLSISDSCCSYSDFPARANFHENGDERTGRE